MEFLKKAQEGFDECQRKFDMLEAEKKHLLEDQKSIGKRLNEIAFEEVALDGEAKGYKTFLDAKENDGDDGCPGPPSTPAS